MVDKICNMLKIETISVGELATNCYLLYSQSAKQAIIIDPGSDYQRINSILNKKGVKPEFIINTHGHIDHIEADNAFSLPVYIHRNDLALLKDPQLNLSDFLNMPFKLNCKIVPLEDNQEICLGDAIRLKVLHTPGHTPGSICLYLIHPELKVVFSGDTLFYEGIGRTDFPGASSKSLLDSINDKLMPLDDETKVYPGHGPMTSIGHERRHNPFLL